MPFWKKSLVVLPVLLILHLTATGVAPLLEGLRALWEPAGVDEVYLLAAFPVGYAMGAVVGLAAAPGTTRLVLFLSLVFSMVGVFGFAALANGYGGGSAALALSGFGAGLALPVAARALGLVSNVVAGGIMAVLVAGAWWLSTIFVGFFKQGLPVSGAPGWTGMYLLQVMIAVVWLPLVLFLGEGRGSRRR